MARTKAKKPVAKPERKYEAVNFKIYEDTDPDLIAYLEGKPKTWLIKEALRFYRDNKDKPQSNTVADASQFMTDL